MLRVHHTAKRGRIVSLTPVAIFQYKINPKYIKLIHSKFSMSNRETYKYRLKNFKQHNSCFNSPSYLRKSSLIQLMLMIFQVSNSFLTVVFISTMILWVWHQQVHSQEEWEHIESTHQQPEIFTKRAICCFRVIILKVFIFGLGLIWVQFSTLPCKSFLPSPWFPSEVWELSNASLILSWNKWLLFVQGMYIFFRYLLQSNYHTCYAEWGYNELASIKLFKQAQTEQDKPWWGLRSKLSNWHEGYSLWLYIRYLIYWVMKKDGKQFNILTFFFFILDHFHICNLNLSCEAFQ